MEKLIIRAVTERDFTQTAIFLEQQTNKNIPRAIWEKLFIKWWIKNPFNPSKEINAHVIECEGEIKGFHCYFKSMTKIDGSYLNTYSASSWYVDKSVRNHSFRVIKAFFSETGPGILINTTPSIEVQKIYESFKFKISESNSSDFYSIMPINFEFFLEHIFAKKLSTFKVVLKILNPIIKILSFLYFEYIRFISKNPIETNIINNFDDFKEIYNESYIKNLNWIFNQDLDPYHTSRRIIEFKKSSKLIGHAIFNIYKNNDMECSYLVDLNIIDKKLINDCLKAIIRYQILLNISYFRFISNRKIENFNFPIPTFTSGKPSFLCKHTDKLIEIPDNFRLTSIDGDQVHFVC